MNTIDLQRWNTGCLGEHLMGTFTTVFLLLGDKGGVAFCVC